MVMIMFGSLRTVGVPGRTFRAGRVVVRAGHPEEVVVNLAVGAGGLLIGFGRETLRVEGRAVGAVVRAVRDVWNGRSGGTGEGGRGVQVRKDSPKDASNDFEGVFNSA